jgi:hypothetical protein
MDVAV